MQHIPGVKLFVIIPVVVHLLVVAGCGKPSHRPEMSKDLDRQTEEQILRKARVDYEQGRDTEVINELNRFLSVHSPSPREREARWLLAQSYERSGNLQAALKQYNIISREVPPGEEKTKVAKRIEALNQRLKQVGTELEPIKVVRTSLSRLDTVGNDPSAFKILVQKGITSVLIDFGCPVKVRQQTPPAVKTRDVSPQSHLPASVSRIHRHGLRAFVGINLRCLGYLDSRSKKQWLDGAYNPAARKIQLSPYFDIFHPQYQKLMAYEIRKMTDSGVDGVVFLAEVPLGMYDGFTPSSVDSFNKAFQAQMNPQTLFENGGSQRHPQRSPEGNQQARNTSSHGTEFWRWTGWKARQRLMVLQGLMDQVHEHKPELPFGLELHPESIEDPLGGLTQFSEDFLEAKQKSFTYFLITPQSIRQIQSEPGLPSSVDLEVFMTQSRNLVDRMTLVIQNPTRIWVSIPWGERTPRTLVFDSPKAGHLQKVSWVYDLPIFLDN